MKKKLPKEKRTYFTVKKLSLQNVILKQNIKVSQQIERLLIE